ncbi:MAG: FAD-dependent oxidoreductase [Eubacteriales bacterium]|nr:FAD-dependent oxidoreductase [Eubacteriales bacterium]
MQTDWAQSQAYPALRGRRNADAVVVGGGFSGLHIALWLCRAGLKVTLLEADALGCGASSRCAGLATVTCASRFATAARNGCAGQYAACQQAALNSLRELCAEPGMRSGWRDADAFLVATNRRDVRKLEREARAMAEAGFPAHVTEATQCPLPARKALMLRAQGVLQPRRHLRSVAEKASSLGVKIFEGSRVTALESGAAHTERGSVMAPYLIVATGFPLLNTPGWYFTRLSQRRGTLLALEKVDPFEGVYLDVSGRFTVRPSGGGAYFWQRGARAGKRERADALDRFGADYGACFPRVEITLLREGYEVETADGLPFIGAYSARTPNLFLATGYGGCGLTGSVAAAQAISASILGLPQTGYECYARRCSPMSLLAGARVLGRQTLGFLGGEARFKAPRCPHMGCKLVYRRDTHTWECPCHGSRFDDIGRVLAAPAAENAEIPRRH